MIAQKPCEILVFLFQSRGDLSGRCTRRHFEVFSKKGEEVVIDGFGRAFASVEAGDEEAELFLSGLADRVPLIEALF